MLKVNLQQFTCEKKINREFNKKSCIRRLHIYSIIKLWINTHTSCQYLVAAAAAATTTTTTARPTKLLLQDLKHE